MSNSSSIISKFPSMEFPHRRVVKHPRYPHAVELQEILKLAGMVE